MSTRRTQRSDSCAAHLQRWAEPLPLTPGSEHKHVIFGDDVEIEVTLRVRRRPQSDEIATFRSAALDRLVREPWRVDHCDAYLRTTRRYNCTANIVAAVVYRSYSNSQLGGPEPAAPGGSGALAFRFVCARHRKDPGVDPREILANIELTASFLVEPRRLWAEEQARRARQSRETNQQRELLEADIRSAHPDWSWDATCDEVEKRLDAWRIDACRASSLHGTTAAKSSP